MSQGKRIAAGIGIYLIALIAYLPASILDRGLAGVSEGRLRLVESHGTLWSGAGRMEIRDASGRQGVSETIAWRVSGFRPTQGKIELLVRVGDISQEVPASLSLAGIEVGPADLPLPSEIFQLWSPAIAAIHLRGSTSLLIERLAITRSKVVAKARLRIHNAGSSLTPVSPLGNYELNFVADGVSNQASLRTLDGPLTVDGSTSWTPGSAWTFPLTASVQTNIQQELAPLMRLVGIESTPGRFKLELR